MKIRDSITPAELDFSRRFAENLRRERQAAGLSQQALGLLMGLSEKTAQRTVLKWEHCERMPTAFYVRLICNALGCTPGDLIPDIPPTWNEPRKGTNSDEIA